MIVLRVCRFKLPGFESHCHLIGLWCPIPLQRLILLASWPTPSTSVPPPSLLLFFAIWCPPTARSQDPTEHRSRCSRPRHPLVSHTRDHSFFPLSFSIIIIIFYFILFYFIFFPTSLLLSSNPLCGALTDFHSSYLLVLQAAIVSPRIPSTPSYYSHTFLTRAAGGWSPSPPGRPPGLIWPVSLFPHHGYEFPLLSRTTFNKKEKLASRESIIFTLHYG